jgi:hypothetical protein
MNYALCPHDGAHLKAVQQRPLLLSCPSCAKRFELTGAGVIEVPGGGA